MKKIIVLLLVAATAIVMMSCSTTYDKNVAMREEAAFSAETHGMWSRPTEVGYEIIGDVEGTAEYSLLFGFIPLGDSPAVDFTIFLGGSANNPGAKFAAYDACKTVGADGIYITSVYTESKTNPFLSTETVTVKGKALKLVDLGTVDQERADTARFLGASGSLNKSNLAPNVSEEGAFGALSNVFSFGF